MLRKLGTYIGDFFLCLMIAPVGVLMVAHRQMKNKQNLIRGGEKILVVAGICAIIFFVALTRYEMLTNPFTYLHGSAGVLGTVLGIRMVRLGIKYDKYKSAVENHDLYAVNAIANFVNFPKKTVVNDLQLMIANGLFPNLKFDTKTQTLKLNAYAMAQKERKPARCDSCGAPATVYEGMQNKCEYCGNFLNY